jgi:cytoskeleton protein RodZ
MKKRLQITAIEKTWLKVNIDKKESREFILNPGDTLEFEASKGYNLLIGNATGVQLTLDDAKVAIPGRQGQVVSLDLP